MDDEIEFITEQFNHNGVIAIRIDSYDTERLTDRQWWLLSEGRSEYHLPALIPLNTDTDEAL